MIILYLDQLFAILDVETMMLSKTKTNLQRKLRLQKYKQCKRSARLSFQDLKAQSISINLYYYLIAMNKLKKKDTEQFLAICKEFSDRFKMKTKHFMDLVQMYTEGRETEMYDLLNNYEIRCQDPQAVDRFLMMMSQIDQSLADQPRFMRVKILKAAICKGQPRSQWIVKYKVLENEDVELQYELKNNDSQPLPAVRNNRLRKQVHEKNPQKKPVNQNFKRSTTSRENVVNIFDLMIDQKKIEIETYCFIFILDKSHEVHIQAQNQRNIVSDQKNLRIILILAQKKQLDSVSISFRLLSNSASNQTKVPLNQYTKTQKAKRLFFISFAQDQQDLDRLRSDIWISVKQVLQIYHIENQKESLMLTYLKELVNFYPQINEYKNDNNQYEFWGRNQDLFVRDEYYFTLFWFSIYKNTADLALHKLEAFSSLPLKPCKKTYCQKVNNNHKIFVQWKQFKDNIEFYRKQSTNVSVQKLLEQNSNNLMDFLFIFIRRYPVQFFFQLQLILRILEQNMNISSIQHFVLIIRCLQRYLTQFDQKNKMETIIRCLGSVAEKILKTSNLRSQIEIQHAKRYNIDSYAERIERLLLNNDQNSFSNSLNANLASIITLYRLCKTVFTKSQYIKNSFFKVQGAIIQIFRYSMMNNSLQIMKVMLIEPVSSLQRELIDFFINRSWLNDNKIQEIYLLFNQEIDIDSIFSIIQTISIKKKSFLYIFKSIIMLNQLKVSRERLKAITGKIASLIKIQTISQDPNHQISIPRLLQWSVLIEDENCKQKIIQRIAEEIANKIQKQRAYEILCKALSQSTGFQEQKQRENIYLLLALPLFGELLNKQIIRQALLIQPRRLISFQSSNQKTFNELFVEIVEDIMDFQLTQHQMSQLKDNLPQIQDVKVQKYNLSEIINSHSQVVGAFKQKCLKLINLFKQYSCFSVQIKEINIVLETFSKKNLKESMELPENIVRIFQEIDKIMSIKQSQYWKKSNETFSLKELMTCFEQALGMLKRKIVEIEIGDVSISIFRQNFLSFERMGQLLHLLDIKKQTINKIKELLHIFQPKSLEMLERSFQIYLYVNRLLPENDENEHLANILKKIKDCEHQSQRISINSQKIYLKKQFVVLCRYYSLKITQDIQQLFQLLNKSKIYQTFDALEKCSELKELIDQQMIDDKLMEELQQYIEDLQSSQISISNLSEFSKVFKIFSLIEGQHQNMKNLKNYIQNHQERPHLSACIFSCHSLIGQFKKLIWKAKNREISFKVQIQSTLQYSKLCFEILSKRIMLKIILNEEDNEKDMSWKELTNYKEKSMLIIKDIKKTENRSSSTEETLKIFEAFEIVYKKIERLFACKQRLFETGYNPQKLKTNIEIKKGCTDSLDKALNQLQENNRLWQKSIKQMYSQSHFLTYFTGPQVSYFKQAILDDKYLPLYQRAFNIQKKRFLRLIKFDNDYVKARQKLASQSDPIKQIKLVSQVSSYLIQKENLPPPGINKLTIIVCNAKYFYSCLLDQDKYANITQVLMCQKTTTLQELQCFFYRAFMNYNKRYFIIASHNLNQEIKSAFMDLLLQFHELKSAELKSAKIAFVTDKTNDKVIGLLTKNNLFDYEKKDMSEKMCELQTQKMQNFIKPTLIVKSARAGLGKTFKIQNLARKNKKKLIYFPVCGNISYESLSERLQKILLDNDEFSLLIQVGHVENKNQLEVFLSQIILFRSFYYQRYIFLPENTPIYIEIENIYCEGQQSSEYHIIKILQEVSQRNFCQNLLDFKQQQVAFDQQNRQDVFTLNYLNMIHTGEISKVDIQFSKQQQLLYPQPQDCKNLVKKYFSDWLRERKSEPTFHIYRNFMNMLFTLFRAFGDSPFFSLSLMEESPEQYKLLRLDQVRISFLKVCIENALQFLEESLNTNNFTNHKFESKIRFQDKIKGHKLLIVPSYDLSSYEFVYFDDRSVPFVIKSLLIKENYALNKISRKINDASFVNEIFKRTALNNFKGEELALKIFEILSHLTGNRDFDRAISQDSKAMEEIQTKIHNLQHYKITLDNFFKMCLIILRSLSRVPIIIMGESGVGKTSLIRFLVEIVYKQKLIIKNIHAGIHEKEINIWIEEITEQAVLRQQNIWVFFDEFNTSDELSYFKEIIVDRRFMGKTLPQNIIFLAACNPYRQRKANKVNVGLAYVPKHKEAKILAFNVKPPCLSMIQLMWDYEQLKRQELQEYIRSMIREMQFSKHNELVIAIVEIHQHFKNQKEISSVSLRDVCRFKELYFWFLFHMPQNQVHHPKRSTKIRQIDPNQIAAILSFCFCYTLGIESRQRRQEVLEKTQKKLRFKKGHMTKVLEQVQIDYIKKLSIQKEKVAFNSALMENLFASLVCLNNRIPILIIGSPGSSKSLSVRMIESSLKGKNSNSQFCKRFPKVNMLYFQGSQSSTSEGVEYIYAKAYEKMKKERECNEKNGSENEEQLHCILFDQIGLAQKSIHNPLKVLHSKLQTDQKWLGFIGISNYQLDSAKMSRFLVLAHTNPGEKQLKETARKIYKGFYPQQDTYQRQFEQLGEQYWQFIKRWNQNQANITNFFGLRDFYSCLKYICQNIGKSAHQQKNNFAKIVQKAVTANFDGQNGSLRLFFEIMKIDKEFVSVNPMDLVKQNLSNTQSRCLMLIIKSDALIPIINESIEINGKKIDVVCLYGSTFEQDKQSEEYNLQTTSQIITHLSRPVILTFKDINNSIQTSLYDLFNKSFTNRRNSRTCRIAVGANSNPKCQVHAEFNSIIYVQQEMVSRLDLPFINRFQKHELNLKSMINKNDSEIFQNIMGWLENLLSVKDALLVLKRQNYILNCSDEAIVTLIIKLKDSKDVQVNIKTQLLRNRTTDFEILMKSNPEIASRYDISNYINHIPWTKNQNDLIIYTYDQFPNLQKSGMSELYVLKMGEVKNQKILKKYLSEGLKYDKMHIILSYQTERDHLNYLLFKAKQMKHFLESMTQIIFIIKLFRFSFIRNKSDTINISYLHNYDQYFVQDLSSGGSLNILDFKTVWEAFEFFNIKQKLQGLQFDALKLIKLTVQQGQNPNISKEVFHAISQLPKIATYRQKILQILSNYLKKQRMNLQFLHNNKKNAHFSVSLFGAVEEYVVDIVKSIIFDLQCSIISEGVIFNGNYLFQSLEKSHYAFLKDIFAGNIEQLLKNMHQRRFEKTLDIFKDKMDNLEQNRRNTAIRQIKNPIFLSLFPQSFLDFSTIFSLRSNSEQTIESIFKSIGLFINNQKNAKMVKTAQNRALLLLERAKYNFVDEICSDGHSQKMMEDLYFYDVVMFSISKFNLQINSSKTVQIYNLFLQLLAQFSLQKKIILLAYDTHLIQHIFGLLSIIFEKNTNFVQELKQSLSQEYINDYLVKLTQLLIKKSCEVIQFTRENIQSHKDSYQYICYFQKMFEKIRALQLDYRQISNFQVPLLIYSLNSLIELQFNLKKQSPEFEDYNYIQLLTGTEKKCSLFQRICESIVSILQRDNSKPNCENFIINYLSLSLFSDWLDSISMYPQEKKFCTKQFKRLCNKYSKFANNSSYYFISLFEFLDQQSLEEMRRRLQLKDEDIDFEIKRQWITLSDNFSVALGNYFNTLITAYICERYIKEDSTIDNSQLLRENASILQQLCNKREWQTTLQSIYQIELMKKLGQAYVQILISGEDLSTIDRFDNLFCLDTQSSSHLRVYLLKLIYQFYESFKEIEEKYIKIEKCRWISKMKDFIIQRKIQYFLPPQIIIESQMKNKLDAFRQNLQKFERSHYQDIKLYHEILNVALYENFQPQKCYELLTFFLLKIYNRGIFSKAKSQRLTKEIDQRQDVKQPRNKLVYSLLLRYIKGQITKEVSYNIENYKEHIMELNYLNMFVSWRRLRVPMMEMFFDGDNSIRPYGQWLNDRFLLGSIHSPTVQRLQFIIRQHKKSMIAKSYSICSASCDYLSPIGGVFYGKDEGCPHPTSQAICPLCNGKLGAQSYNKLINEQLGARIIEPERVVNEMERMRSRTDLDIIFQDRKMTLSLKGYHNGIKQKAIQQSLQLRKTLSQSACDHMEQSTSLATHYLQCYLNNLIWHYLTQFDLIHEDQFEPIWKESKNTMRRQFRMNLQLYQQKLRQQIKLKEDEFIIWNMGIGKYLFQFLQTIDHKYSLKVSADRDRFQEELQGKFCRFYDTEKDRLIQESRNVLQVHKGDIIQQIGDIRRQENEFKYIRMFKVVKEKPGMENLRGMYQPKLAKEYKILHQLVNKKQVWEKLDDYKTIFSFLSSIQTMFDGKISRRDSQERLDKMVKDKQKYSELLEKFVDAWNRVASNKFELNLDCHSDKVLGYLPSITKQSPLKMFLFVLNTVNNQHAQRLIAFTIIAANDYNLTCRYFDHLLASTYPEFNQRSNFGKIKLNPTCLTNEHLMFGFQRQKLQDIIESYSSQSVEYGISTSHYSFQKIQRLIVRELVGRRYLESEKQQFRYIHYIGEQVQFITELRNRSQQKTLAELGLKQPIVKYIEKISKDKEDLLLEIKALQAGLQKIVIFFMNMKCPGSDEKIEHFIQKNKIEGISQQFKKQALTKVPLFGLADLYQLIEYHSFESVPEILDSAYNSELSKEEKMRIQEIKGGKRSSLPSWEEFKWAMYKFAGRGLCGSRYKEDQKLQDHVCSVLDYWPKGIDEEKVGEDLKKLLSPFTLAKVGGILRQVPFKVVRQIKEAKEKKQKISSIPKQNKHKKMK